jgi:hypothetical protein
LKYQSVFIRLYGTTFKSTVIFKLCELNCEILLILPDWTAEDYALMGGYHEVATELKSPSERMVMSFTENVIDSETCGTGVASAKRSVSDASLLSDQQEVEKEVRAWIIPMVQDLLWKVSVQLVMKYTAFVELKGLLPASQSLPLDGPYP